MFPAGIEEIVIPDDDLSSEEDPLNGDLPSGVYPLSDPSRETLPETIEIIDEGVVGEVDDNTLPKVPYSGAISGMLERAMSECPEDVTLKKSITPGNEA
jgi:hypothetical protein